MSDAVIYHWLCLLLVLQSLVVVPCLPQHLRFASISDLPKDLVQLVVWKLALKLLGTVPFGVRPFLVIL